MVLVGVPPPTKEVGECDLSARTRIAVVSAFLDKN